MVGLSGYIQSMQFYPIEVMDGGVVFGAIGGLAVDAAAWSSRC
jgi:hypothetical protein